MPWLVHDAGQQKTTQQCKNIIPQTKNTFFKSEIIVFATNGIVKQYHLYQNKIYIFKSESKIF